ncbi:aminopeptidase [Candidatus Woesearchaeota archaeon]|nr:aminopeptidase [Candidatus Woesearchaeota archaeon]
MESKEVLSWLGKIGLINNTKEAIFCCENILKNCLYAQKGDNVLIIGDYGCENYNISSILSAAYHKSAQNLKLNPTIIMQSPKLRGEECDQKVVYALADLPKESIVIVNISGKLGNLRYLGNSFRKFNAGQKHKFSSSSNLGMINNLDYHKILNCLDLDYNDLERKSLKLKQLMDEGKKIQLKTIKGTDFQSSIYGKKALVNNALFKNSGEGGNIPAGEVYIAPRAKKKNFGTVIIDGSLATREGTYLLKEPVTLKIENSEVMSITGGKGAELLQRSINWADENSAYKWGNRRIGEIGIGINPKAEIMGVTVIDEKALGTAHIAVGSNAWFGGTIYSKIHLDQVFRDAKVYIDDEYIDIRKL